MIIKPGESVTPFKNIRVDRPWGHYGLYASNEPCTTKVLYVKKGETLSLQYHIQRAQFYKTIDAGFTIQYSTKPVPLEIANMVDDTAKFKALEEFLVDHLVTVENLEEEASFGFHEYIIHRASYHGDRAYGRFLDIAWGINDECDICRIKDAYGRKGSTE